MITIKELGKYREITPTQFGYKKALEEILEIIRGMSGVEECPHLKLLKEEIEG